MGPPITNLPSLPFRIQKPHSQRVMLQRWNEQHGITAVSGFCIDRFGLRFRGAGGCAPLDSLLTKLPRYWSSPGSGARRSWQARIVAEFDSECHGTPVGAPVRVRGQSHVWRRDLRHARHHPLSSPRRVVMRSAAPVFTRRDVPL